MDKEKVLKLAKLARINVSDEEAENLTQEFESILNYVSDLKVAINNKQPTIDNKGKKNFPNRKVLGVLIPTAEECAKYKRVGILGTLGTIASNTFPKEIKKLNKKVKVFQNPAPMLVPLAEEGEKTLAKQFILKYLKPFLHKKLDVVALGCTHYPFYKSEIKKILGPKIKVISQDEIIPKKLKNYFVQHPEIEKKLAKNRKAKILVTDITPNIKKLSQKWFGKNIKPELVNL